MPITASYQVRCDICFDVMDGEYDTREEAEAARKELGWENGYNGTACPEHNTTAA